LREDRVMKNLEFCHSLWLASKPCSQFPGPEILSEPFIKFVGENKKVYPNLHSFHIEKGLAV